MLWRVYDSRSFTKKSVGSGRIRRNIPCIWAVVDGAVMAFRACHLRALISTTSYRTRNCKLR